MWDLLYSTEGVEQSSDGILGAWSPFTTQSPSQRRRQRLKTRELVGDDNAKLRITIFQAFGLRKPGEQDNELPDPLCICEVPGRKDSRITTQQEQDQTSPVWNYTGEIKRYILGDPLEFKVFHENFKGRRAILGEACLKRSQFYPHGFSGDLDLRIGKISNASFSGRLRIKVEITKYAANSILENFAASKIQALARGRAARKQLEKENGKSIRKDIKTASQQDERAPITPDLKTSAVTREQENVPKPSEKEDGQSTRKDIEMASQQGERAPITRDPNTSAVTREQENAAATRIQALQRGSIARRDVAAMRNQYRIEFSDSQGEDSDEQHVVDPVGAVPENAVVYYPPGSKLPLYLNTDRIPKTYREELVEEALEAAASKQEQRKKQPVQKLKVALGPSEASDLSERLAEMKTDWLREWSVAKGKMRSNYAGAKEFFELEKLQNNFQEERARREKLQQDLETLQTLGSGQMGAESEDLSRRLKNETLEVNIVRQQLKSEINEVLALRHQCVTELRYAVAEEAMARRAELQTEQLAETREEMVQELREAKETGAKTAAALERMHAPSLRVRVLDLLNLGTCIREKHSGVYCVCEVPGKPESRFETKLMNSIDKQPWNHVCAVVGYVTGDPLHFSIWEKEDLSRAMCSTELDSTRFYPNGFSGTLALTQGAKLSVSIEIIGTPRPVNPMRPTGVESVATIPKRASTRTSSVGQTRQSLSSSVGQWRQSLRGSTGSQKVDRPSVRGTMVVSKRESSGQVSGPAVAEQGATKKAALEQKEKVSQEQVEEKALADKRAAENADGEKAAQDEAENTSSWWPFGVAASVSAHAKKTAAEQGEADRLAKEKAAEEKAMAEKQAAEQQSAAEKAEQDKKVAEEKTKAIAEKQAAEEQAAAAAKKVEQEKKVAEEKALAEKQAAEEQAAVEQAEQEKKAAAEKAGAEHETVEKLADDEAENTSSWWPFGVAASVSAHAKKTTAEQAAEQADAERLAKEKAPEEKAAAENQAAEDQAKKVAQEKLAAGEADKVETPQEKLARLKAAKQAADERAAAAKAAIAQKAPVEDTALTEKVAEQQDTSNQVAVTATEKVETPQEKLARLKAAKQAADERAAAAKAAITQRTDSPGLQTTAPEAETPQEKLARLKAAKQAAEERAAAAKAKAGNTVAPVGAPASEGESPQERLARLQAAKKAAEERMKAAQEAAAKARETSANS